jgi:hypothetical protein
MVSCERGASPRSRAGAALARARAGFLSAAELQPGLATLSGGAGRTPRPLRFPARLRAT